MSVKAEQIREQSRECLAKVLRKLRDDVDVIIEFPLKMTLMLTWSIFEACIISHWLFRIIQTLLALRALVRYYPLGRLWRF